MQTFKNIPQTLLPENPHYRVMRRFHRFKVRSKSLYLQPSIINVRPTSGLKLTAAHRKLNPEAGCPVNICSSPKFESTFQSSGESHKARFRQLMA